MLLRNQKMRHPEPKTLDRVSLRKPVLTPGLDSFVKINIFVYEIFFI